LCALFVPQTIALNLIDPVLAVRLRDAGATLAIMSMPKILLHEYHFATGGKHQVRLSEQVGSVKALAIASLVQHAAHSHFGLCVLVLDRPHDATSL
jgi:hypothetical protein